MKMLLTCAEHTDVELEVAMIFGPNANDEVVFKVETCPKCLKQSRLYAMYSFRDNLGKLAIQAMHEEEGEE